MDAMITWIKANPGKFSYAGAYPTADGGDFTGAVFTRMVFYNQCDKDAVCKSWKDLEGSVVDEKKYAPAWAATAKVLNELEPFLSGYNADTKTMVYPKNLAAVDALFGAGTTLLNFDYSPGKTGAKIGSETNGGKAVCKLSADGNSAVAGSTCIKDCWSGTVKGYVLDSGTISNTNFVAIPINSGSKEAAMVAGNVIASAEGQFTRADTTTGWGALQAFDPAADNFANGGWDTVFNSLEAHASAPTVQALAKSRMAELNSVYKDRIQADWKKDVDGK